MSGGSEAMREDWYDLDDLVDKVREMIEVGLHDEAMVLLDKYKEIFADEPDLFLLYAQIHAERNEPALAIPYLEKGLALDATNVDCLLGMFYAYSQLDDMKRAERYLLDAERLEPDSEAVLGSLIWYSNEIEHYGEALAYFERARNAGRIENPETFRNAGVAFQRLRRLEDGEACFRAALGLNPQFDEARDLLADSLLMRGETDQAVALYRDHLKSSPNHVRSLSRLVFCLCQSERFDEAVVEARNAIRQYPNSAVGYVDLAFVFLNMSDLDRALDTVNKAIDIAPLDSEAFRLRGILYSEKGFTAAAEEQFEKAMSLDPNNMEILRDYYHHLQNAGEHARMEKMVQTVIEREYPYCVEDYWFLAEHYRQAGENLRAFHHLRKAFRLVPGESEFLPPMIDILLDEGHLSFAVPIIARYVEQSGWDDVMEQYAAHRRLRAGSAQEGLRLLRFLGERGPQFRKYIYNYYLVRFVRLLVLLVLLMSTVAAALFGGSRGALIMAGVVAFVLTGWIVAAAIAVRLRRRARRREELDSERSGS